MKSCARCRGEKTGSDSVYCLPCRAAYMREYRARRADYKAEQQERNRRYKAGAGRARASERERMRKARLRGADAQHIDPLVVLEMDDGTCGICGGDVDPRCFELDHIVPLSRGGDHVSHNVQVAHPECNRRKYNHH